MTKSIMAQELERLQQENDALRAQLLRAPDAQMVLFIAEFETWLEAEVKEWNEEYNSVWVRACREMINETFDKWSKLKQRLEPADSEGQVE